MRLSKVDLPRAGQWSICYCARYDRDLTDTALPAEGGTGHCDEDVEFHSLAGVLTIKGPSPNNQDQTCIAGVPCTLNIAGQSLSGRDRLAFVQVADGAECGVTSVDFKIATDTFKALAAHASGDHGTFEMAGGEAGDLPIGGQWLMCICTDDTNGCLISSDFPALLGVLTVLGPSPMMQDQTCTTGVDCTLTFTGQGLSNLDKVSFAPLYGYCGGTERDSNLTGNVHDVHLREVIGQDKYFDVDVSSGSARVQLTRMDLPEGGQWRMCYCINNYDGCDDGADFTSFSGTLSVRGVYPQDYHCVAGTRCTIGGGAFAGANVGGSAVFEATKQENINKQIT